MTTTSPALVLEQARARAQHARRIKLVYLAGHLLAFGRVAPNEVGVGELVVITEKQERCRYGLTLTPWSVIREGLARDISGWVLTRVTPDKRLVSPTADDVLLSRTRLTAIGLDWTRAPYEQGST